VRARVRVCVCRGRTCSSSRAGPGRGASPRSSRSGAHTRSRAPVCVRENAVCVREQKCHTKYKVDIYIDIQGRYIHRYGRERVRHSCCQTALYLQSTHTCTKGSMTDFRVFHGSETIIVHNKRTRCQSFNAQRRLINPGQYLTLEIENAWLEHLDNTMRCAIVVFEWSTALAISAPRILVQK
jgi:hypothetical protein